MVGSTQFIAKPAGFGLSAIRCSSYGPSSCAPALAAPGNNPGASDARGAAFIQAGANFSVSVSALNAAGAVTPNFGHEAVPEGVTLGSSLLAPAGGHLASLANPSGFGAFSLGVASGNSFSWSEVGALGLTPRLASGDYLGTGDVATSPTVAVGRFIPARLAITSPSLVHRATASCSPAASFSYLGEPFQLGFDVSAQGLSGDWGKARTATFKRRKLPFTVLQTNSRNEKKAQ